MNTVIPLRPSAKVFSFEAAKFDRDLVQVRLQEARRKTKKSAAAKRAYGVAVKAGETL